MESVELRKQYSMSFLPLFSVLRHSENKEPLFKGLSVIWGLIRSLGLQLAGLCRSYLSIIDACFHFLPSQKVSTFANPKPQPLVRQWLELKKNKDYVKRNRQYGPSYSFCHFLKSEKVIHLYHLDRSLTHLLSDFNETTI